MVGIGEVAALSQVLPLTLGHCPRASLAAQMVKNLPAMQETWVSSLVWEDLLEKGVATHSIIFAWKIR